GKWYFEATYTGSQYGSAIGNLAAGVGFAKSNVSTPNVDVSDSSLYGSILAFSQTGHVNNFNAPTSARSQIASGDVIGFALNYDAGTYTIYVNNTSTSSGNLNFTGELTPWTNAYYSGSYFILNTGQRPFAYTAPSGFKALCTANLPAPLVTKPNTVMDVSLWTGNGGTQSITLPGGFSPDFVWVKARSNAQDHYLFDVIRGGAGILRSNTTGAESTGTSYLSFDSAGFSSLNGLSSSGYTYAGWCWDAGTSTVTNTQGSISSTVRANPTAGFSIVAYTGTGSAATVGHSLGVAPSLIIVKSRSNAGGEWVVYHKDLGRNVFLQLQSTSASATVSNYWGTADPTSSLFSLNTYGGNNLSSATFIAYCFAPVVGYSSFGSYTGNGSTDGPFVYTGFRPKFILLKVTNTLASWQIKDTSRDSYNVSVNTLYPNLSNAEANDSNIDILSNGFKLRTTSSENGSGNTIIYAAFAESPFNYARAR
ncbi:hypothetical protein EBZ39_17230, partial [bacterium]|nr:hypothetical protein [bacterium]